MTMTTDNGGRCHCGAMWFRLVASSECDEPGQVAIDERGRIMVHAGALVCASCGALWAAPRQRLAVVRNSDDRQNHPTKIVRAPFTAEQVRALNRWQANPRFHPFTCADDTHPAWGQIVAGPFIGRFGDQRVLVATVDGWVCSDPNCGYTQDWAHATMVT